MGVRNNRGAILDLIRSEKVVSRVELATQAGLTEASVSRIVKQLIADGIVEETGRAESTGGKRRTLLQLAGRARHAIGVYLTDSHVRCVLTDMTGRVVASAPESPRGMDQENRAVVVAETVTTIEALIAEAGIGAESLLGIGIAIPGREQISRYQRSSRPYDFAEWDWRVVESDFADATGMPIIVENDSTCAALGEHWTSRSATTQDIGVVTIASGIGFGLVTNGDVYRGATSNVGEIGHMSVDVDGPDCPCGNKGCLDGYASPRNVIAAVRNDMELRQRFGLADGPPDIEADYDRIAIAAESGNPVARSLLIDGARRLGFALVSLTNILDLEKVVLAGPALAHTGELFRDTVSAELNARAFSRHLHPTKVELSKIGRDVAPIGAATLVVHRRLGGFDEARAGAMQPAASL
jgi:predicted NBD/HSP70 family sugar kinase